jgi:ABC-type sulfate/molybdate transport systems ATPase subunit
MAFLSQRDLLLLDEFLANLDPPNRKALAAALKRLVRERSVVALYVSHDLREALTWCDELLVLGDGHIQYQSPCAPGSLPTPEELERLYFGSDREK